MDHDEKIQEQASDLGGYDRVADGHGTALSSTAASDQPRTSDHNGHRTEADKPFLPSFSAMANPSVGVIGIGLSFSSLIC